MRGKLLLVFAVLILFSLNFVMAGFDLSDYYINTVYAPSDIIRGVIEISFDDASANSILSGFEKNITLKAFLDANNLENGTDYDCAPASYTGNISSDALELKLEKAGFRTPSELGNHTFSLKLNNEEIFNKTIRIANLVKIQDIMPNQGDALKIILFTVLIQQPDVNLSYEWDFGDGVTETSSKNRMTHVYDGEGIYELIVSVENENGTAFRTFEINITASQTSLNETLTDYEKKVNSIETKINALPAWLRDEIKNKSGIKEIKAELQAERQAYENLSANDNEGYDEIASNLALMDIPINFNVTTEIKPSNVVPAAEQFSEDTLKSLGLEINNSENYPDLVTNWFLNNLDMQIESKTYSIIYKDDILPLASYNKITLVPKTSLENVYFIISGNPSEIIFKEDYGQINTDNSVGIVYDFLIESQTIEFLYPEEIQLTALPIYVATAFEGDLQTEPEIICNNNGICEEGEDYKNCREDCKPIFWTIILYICLLFGAFIVYIVLQEWYKRYYESHLFKDRNQLFNLINFMNNSANQGLKKNEIFDKLKEMRWEKEQVVYAWKKLNGQRTGMWEIPVFKWVEKKQVRKELAKRGATPYYGNINYRA